MSRRIFVIEERMEASKGYQNRLMHHWAVGIEGYGILESGVNGRKWNELSYRNGSQNHEWRGIVVGSTAWSDSSLDGLIRQYNDEDNRGGTRLYNVNSNNCQTCTKWIVRSIGGDVSKCPKTSHARVGQAAIGGAGIGASAYTGAVAAATVAGPVGWALVGACALSSGLYGAIAGSAAK
jgi:hypothetical protein